MQNVDLEKGILWFARVALAAAFLSGIASRFGWWGAGVGYGDFAHFERYTAEVTQNRRQLAEAESIKGSREVLGSPATSRYISARLLSMLAKITIPLGRERPAGSLINTRRRGHSQWQSAKEPV